MHHLRRTGGAVYCRYLFVFTIYPYGYLDIPIIFQTGMLIALTVGNLFEYRSGIPVECYTISHCSDANLLETHGGKGNDADLN
jgi:hypothetical protein